MAIAMAVINGGLGDTWFNSKEDKNTERTKIIFCVVGYVVFKCRRRRESWILNASQGWQNRRKNTILACCTHQSNLPYFTEAPQTEASSTKRSKSVLLKLEVGVVQPRHTDHHVFNAKAAELIWRNVGKLLVTPTRRTPLSSATSLAKVVLMWLACKLVAGWVCLVSCTSNF